jgi:hypothetical protein
MKYGEVESLVFIPFGYVDVYKVRLGVKDFLNVCSVACRRRLAEIRDGVLLGERESHLRIL